MKTITNLIFIALLFITASLSAQEHGPVLGGSLGTLHEKVSGFPVILRDINFIIILDMLIGSIGVIVNLQWMALLFLARRGLIIKPSIRIVLSIV